MQVIMCVAVRLRGLLQDPCASHLYVQVAKVIKAPCSTMLIADCEAVPKMLQIQVLIKQKGIQLYNGES